MRVSRILARGRKKAQAGPEAVQEKAQNADGMVLTNDVPEGYGLSKENISKELDEAEKARFYGLVEALEKLAS